MRRLFVGLCAVVLGLTGVACGDDTGGGGGGGVNQLAAAADSATEAGSSRMTMTMAMSVSGQELEIEGEGAFDFDAEIGEMTMTVSGAGLGEPQSIETIVDSTYLYMKMPEQLGGDGGWIRMDLTSIPGGANQFSQDPSQYLSFLRGASDEIEEVGTEEIDGTETTHYRAELSFDKILEQAPNDEAADEIRTQLEALGGEVDSIPADVWIDEDGLPRRMELKMSVEAQGESAEMDITMDLFDYGVEVDVEPPSDYEEISSPPGG